MNALLFVLRYNQVSKLIVLYNKEDFLVYNDKFDEEQALEVY